MINELKFNKKIIIIVEITNKMSIVRFFFIREFIKYVWDGLS